MQMQWQIERGIRADIVTYAARNMTGKRAQIRIFPGGNRQGNIDGSNLASMVIRAPYGVRVVLITEPGPDWESHPWRVVRMVKGVALRPVSEAAMPGVRLPDIERLDLPKSKKTETELISSYAISENLEGSTEWTYGRLGPLHGQVKMIRIEREEARDALEPTPAELVARDLLSHVAQNWPDGLNETAAAASAALRTHLEGAETHERVRAFEAFAKELKA